MTLSVPTGQAVDLRVRPVDEVLDRVARSLQVRLLPDTVVRKRRSVGARTDRDTWVRVERRSLGKITDQGWNGTECAARLEGIARPAWHRCVVWRDADELVMWRADETDLLPAAPVGSAVLSEAPELSDEWWEALNASLDALAAHQTRRVATPDTDTITQELVTDSIRGVFPGDFDWSGIALANRVIHRYGAQPWRMGAEDYEHLAARTQARGVPQHPLTGRQVAADWDPDLAPAMTTLGIALHEEATRPARGGPGLNRSLSGSGVSIRMAD